MPTTACRSSFQNSHQQQGDDSSSRCECCPPTKIRRTSPLSNSSGGSTNISDSTSVVSEYYDESYLTITPLGFGLNDFLPLDYSKTHRQQESRQEKNHLTAGTSSKLFNISQLSDDILGQCLFNGFLDTFETTHLMVVNKRIRKIGLSQVQRLDLRRCERLTTTNVAKIAACFQNLTELDFSYCPNFGGTELEKILPASKTLKHLILKGTNVDDESLTKYLQQVHHRFGECKLESLDLSAISKEGSHLIGDAAAKAISIYCPNLKLLRLGWCKNLTDKGMNFLYSLPHLSELDVSLTSISFKSCHGLLQIMGPRLEVLDLSATNIFKVDDDQQSLSFDPLQRLSTLKLRFCQDLTSPLLEYMIETAKSLRDIDVKHSGPEGGRLVISPKFSEVIVNRRININGAWFSSQTENT